MAQSPHSNSASPVPPAPAAPLVRIFCAEQNPLLRDGIAYAINGQPGLRVVAEAISSEIAIVRYPALQPDLTLIDFNLPSLGGLETILSIRRQAPLARFLLLTPQLDDALSQQIAAVPVEACLSRHALRAELIPAIRSVLDGGRVVPFAIAAPLASLTGVPLLTPREIEVLRLLDLGNTEPDIASALGISPDLVAAHLRNILQRLNASGTDHALTIARNRGHLKPSSIDTP